MTDHTTRSFDAERGVIVTLVCELGAEVERQLDDAMHALLHGNRSTAEAVRTRDAELDALAESIETDAINLIAKRQPMAGDLRHVIAALHIASNLERAGDLANNIAKRAMAMMPAHPPVALREPLERMAKLAIGHLRETRLAFLGQDAARAQRVWEGDAQIDQLHTQLFGAIVQAMSDNPSDTLDLAHLLFIAKNIERVGDHATNIAENVVYIVSGARPTQARPKQDDSSTMSSHGSGVDRESNE
jgi:phosphate transport system protein